MPSFGFQKTAFCIVIDGLLQGERRYIGIPPAKSGINVYNI
ncbi:unknown [Prevotella sp. CAG:1124]|nr:unknown [Prevotella sp. CAG:1124]